MRDYILSPSISEGKPNRFMFVTIVIYSNLIDDLEIKEAITIGAFIFVVCSILMLWLLPTKEEKENISSLISSIMFVNRVIRRLSIFSKLGNILSQFALKGMI